MSKMYVVDESYLALVKSVMDDLYADRLIYPAKPGAARDLANRLFAKTPLYDINGDVRVDEQ